MAPFKSKELKSDWRSDFLTEETDCDCEGCGQDPCIKCGESHHNINEEVQGGVSVETYTKDTKFTEIETVDIIKAKPLVNEGKTSRYRGFDVGGSGHKDSMNRGTDEKIIHNVTGVNYNLMVNKGKKTVDPKKNEVIAASYEIGKIQLPKINREETESQQSLVEEVFVEDYMTDLYNEGYSVDEINEYLLEEYEIDEEYLEEAWGKVLKGLGQIAGKALKSGAKRAAARAVKDTGTTIGAAKKVAKFATNPTNLARANKDTQKVIDTVAKGAKDTKELAARTYAAGQKARKIVDAGGKNLLGPAKSFKKLTSDFKKSQEIATRASNIQKIRDAKPVVTNVKSSGVFDIKQASTNVGKVELPKINWRPTTPKGGNVTATQKATTSVKQITTSQPNKGLNAKFSKVKIRHRGAQELAKTQGKNIVNKKTGETRKQVLARMNKAVSTSNKPGTVSQKTNKIIKDIKATPIPKEKAIVKSPGGKITPSPSGSLAKTTDKGSAIVANPGGKVTKEVIPNKRKLSVVDKLNKAKRGSEGKGTTYTSKGVRQLPPSDDPTKTKVAAASLGLGSYGGYEFSKKVGLIGKKEKKESFSNWRSEINL